MAKVVNGLYIYYELVNTHTQNQEIELQQLSKNIILQLGNWSLK